MRMLEDTTVFQSDVEIYNKYTPYLVAVDCIIFGFIESELRLLIIKRVINPCKGSWSLMGGFVCPDESMDEAAYRILYDLTGLKDLYMTQLYTHGNTDRDPGARVISTSYYSLIKIQDINPHHEMISNARWCPINELPELIFDHSKMVEMALDSLRDEAHRKPIGFELLPPKFTLPQLQSLYEAIYQQKFDKRNFRKSMLKMNLLDQLDEKNREDSKKGAWLYRFNEEKYKELLRQGFFFNIPV
jgi:ADP-ribose pyrophosphatase YjhB (NUDIX family)